MYNRSVEEATGWRHSLARAAQSTPPAAIRKTPLSARMRFRRLMGFRRCRNRGRGGALRRRFRGAPACHGTIPREAELPNVSCTWLPRSSETTAEGRRRGEIQRSHTPLGSGGGGSVGVRGAGEGALLRRRFRGVPACHGTTPHCVSLGYNPMHS